MEKIGVKDSLLLEMIEILISKFILASIFDTRALKTEAKLNPKIDIIHKMLVFNTETTQI